MEELWHSMGQLFPSVQADDSDERYRQQEMVSFPNRPASFLSETALPCARHVPFLFVRYLM